MNRFRIILALLTFLFASIFVAAQKDSIVLSPNILGFKDVLTNENLFDNQKVVSASRSLKEVSDLPFTIVIITKEEILENGYTTLVDVLKMAPGIRTSQPGSASEGETFLMRGLKGNTYTKILINGVPVKPTSIVSMPIGAQLPIRQAERIEIIYGPAAALYGADANAGVINIIIEQTNKPLYTQANLSIGTGQYSNVDVMFGGKMGKNKRILNFNFYGSSTKYEKRDIVYEISDLFNPENYVNQDLLLENPNYRGNPGFIRTFPHESALIGFELQYRIFKLKSELMSRKDHSAIGLNPAAVSYDNPLNFIGEQIGKTELSIGKQYKKISFRSVIGSNQYTMDQNSSTDYIENTLKRVTGIVNTNRATNPIDSTINYPLLDSLNNDVFDTYFSGTRYSYAQSFEGYFDQSLNYYPFKNFEISLGFQYRLMTINPRVDYLPDPRDSGFNPSPIRRIRDNQREFTAFTQTYWTFKKFNIIGGLQLYNNPRYGRFVNPRYSMLYKLSKGLSLRAFYGRSFRAPSLFYRSNSYYVNAESQDLITNVNIELEPERTTSYEFGMRWSPNKNVSADIVYYNTNTQNLITSNLILDVPFTDAQDFFFGYSNFANSQTKLQGVQSSFVVKNLLPNNKLNATLNVTYAEGFEVIQNANVGSDKVREVPKWIIKSRIFYRPFKRWSFTTDHIFMKDLATSENGIVQEFVFPSDFKDFYTLDFLVRFELNRNFKIYLKFFNFLSKKHAGLNATNTPDDLIINPQENTYIRLGMNYKMN